MKNQLIIFILLLISILGYGQSDYSRGFNVGYKEGYCYNDFGCISPIPPITPMPYIGEDINSYQDGYNRGFKMGLEDKQRDKRKNSQGNANMNNTGTNKPYVYQSPYVSPDYDLLLKAIQMKQAQYERNEQIKKEKAQSLTKQIKAYYNSFDKYPENIKYGWHNVISLNNYDFCEERKVFVVGNKITKYVIDDWFQKTVSYTLPINKGKTMLQLNNEDGSKGEMLEIYFLEYLNDPYSTTIEPTKPGKISFWSSVKRSGEIKVYIEGNYIGSITSYFKEGTPLCGQNGTLTFEYKPGTYNYKAVCNKWTWNGQITIVEGGCSLMGLRK